MQAESRQSHFVLEMAMLRNQILEEQGRELGEKLDAQRELTLTQQKELQAANMRIAELEVGYFLRTFDYSFYWALGVVDGRIFTASGICRISTLKQFIL